LLVLRKITLSIDLSRIVDHFRSSESAIFDLTSASGLVTNRSIMGMVSVGDNCALSLVKVQRHNPIQRSRLRIKMKKCNLWKPAI
jgi:hypothetical protein